MSKIYIFHRFFLQLFTLTTLGLITILCYFSVFQLRLPSRMTMVPFVTDESSLIYLSGLLCRVAPSICYNFLSILGYSERDGIAFSKVMGTLKTDSLKYIGIVGEYFTYFVPMLIPIVAVITIFDIPSRILSSINFKERFSFISRSAYSSTPVLLGKELVDLERVERMKKINV